MKKIVFLLSLLFSIFSFSQNYDYINLTKPRPDNLLSNYFRNAVPTRLLKNVRYSRNKQTIILSFYINKLKEPYKISFNNYYNKPLNEAIKKAFLKYPLENLGLQELNPQKKYSFQVVIRKNIQESIFSCSSTILTHSLPVCDSCSDLEFYEDIQNCVNSKLKDYFDKNTDSTSIKIEKEKTKNLKARLKIDKKGKVILKKGKGSELFAEATNNFPIFNEPAKLSGSPIIYNYTYFPLIKKFTSLSNKSKDLNFIANSTNDFSKYIIEKLETKYIKNSGLNRINKTLSLNFELDKKGKPINIHTNARSYNLEKRILAIFKEYPFKKLDLGERFQFSHYYTSILTFKNNKTQVETFNTFFAERVPIFPGCKRSKDISEARKCFSKGIQIHFSQNFDSKLPNRLGLSKGKKRILISFKINKKGKTEDIKVRAPHQEIKDEIISVLGYLPKVKPGLQRGKPVSVKYSIPFTIIVE